MKKIILSISALLCLLSLPVFADPTVSVLYFENTTGETEHDWLRKGIADILLSELAQNDKVTVVERTRLEDLIQERKLALSGLTDSNNSVEIGNMLQADTLVMGSFMITGNQISINGRIVDVETARVKSSFRTSGYLTAMLSWQHDLLMSLLQSMNIDGRPKSIASQTDSLNAMKNYYIGLDLLDKGLGDKAVQYFSTASQADALYFKPRMSLEQAYLFIRDFRRLQFQKNLNEAFRNRQAVLTELSATDPAVSLEDAYKYQFLHFLLIIVNVKLAIVFDSPPDSIEIAEQQEMKRQADEILRQDEDIYHHIIDTGQFWRNKTPSDEKYFNVMFSTLIAMLSIGINPYSWLTPAQYLCEELMMLYPDKMDSHLSNDFIGFRDQPFFSRLKDAIGSSDLYSADRYAMQNYTYYSYGGGLIGVYEKLIDKIEAGYAFVQGNGKAYDDPHREFPKVLWSEGNIDPSENVETLLTKSGNLVRCERSNRDWIVTFADRTNGLVLPDMDAVQDVKNPGKIDLYYSPAGEGTLFIRDKSDIQAYTIPGLNRTSKNISSDIEYCGTDPTGSLDTDGAFFFNSLYRYGRFTTSHEQYVVGFIDTEGNKYKVSGEKYGEKKIITWKDTFSSAGTLISLNPYRMETDLSNEDARYGDKSAWTTVYGWLVGGDSVLYLCAKKNGEGVYLWAIDTKSGYVKWKKNISIPDRVTPLQPVVGKNGNVYWAVNDTLSALDSNGRIRWQKKFDEALTGTPLLGDADMVYVGAGQRLYAFSADGSPAWSVRLGFSITGTSSFEGIGEMVMDGSGILYVNADRQYAIRTESSGPMNSPWPMFRHDPYHSGNQQYPVAVGGE